jgi:xylan 1,4-beta-xylosidase
VLLPQHGRLPPRLTLRHLSGSRPPRPSTTNARRASLTALLTVLVLLGFGVPRSTGVTTGPTARYANPVVSGDLPDPSVLRAGGLWWAAATATSGAGMPLLTSGDLVHWSPAGTVLPGPPAWADPSAQWAPSLVRIGSRFLVYYSVRPVGRPFCIAVAAATSIGGPYDDQGLVTCSGQGAIDPEVAFGPDGAPYLISKQDGNAVGRRTRIWARRLTPDGLHTMGRATVLLRNDAAWEGGVVEAPQVITRRGWVYLFYSGNGYGGRSCRYAVGVARSRSVLGPFVKAPHNPILAGNGAWRCPGHTTVTQDAAGQWWMLHHGIAAGDADDAAPRQLLLDPVRWDRDGWPSVNGGRGSATTGAAPMTAAPLARP